MDVWEDGKQGYHARCACGVYQWREDPEPRRMREKRMRWAFWISGFVAGFVIGIGVVVNSARAEDLTGPLRVIDGDTVWHYAPGESRPEKIRLLDIDAPESFRSTCEGELIAGLRAKARLAELLQQKPVSIERCAEHRDRCEDRFGRTLARLHTPSGETGAILLREGLALPYIAGQKPARNAKWCGR